jgi:hypothetical protein
VVNVGDDTKIADVFHSIEIEFSMLSKNKEKRRD